MDSSLDVWVLNSDSLTQCFTAKKQKIVQPLFVQGLMDEDLRLTEYRISNVYHPSSRLSGFFYPSSLFTLIRIEALPSSMFSVFKKGEK
jgi:hypothetical protein